MSSPPFVILLKLSRSMFELVMVESSIRFLFLFCKGNAEPESVVFLGLVSCVHWHNVLHILEDFENASLYICYL